MSETFSAFVTGAPVEATPLPAIDLIPVVRAGVTYRTTLSAASPATVGVLSVLSYGADPTGVADSSAAFQAAINAAVTAGKAVAVPSGVYKINAALDAHNLDQLSIYGDGAEAPAFGLALAAPTKGTVIIGNTGSGGCIIDFVGSNNILIRDVAFTSLGAINPSTIGLIFGNSTRAQVSGSGGPGGANIGLENVTVQLGSAGVTLPVLHNGGAGNSHYWNLWTLGDYGLALTSTNPFLITPPYGVFGTPIDVDGVSLVGLNLLGYTDGSPLYLERANDIAGDQIYIATIFGGPGYAGVKYGVQLTNCIDLHLKLEVDYYPAILYSAGYLINAKIQGIIFQNQTPVTGGFPLVAAFDGTQVREVEMAIYPVGNVAGAPYHYTISPTVTLFENNKFYFDVGASANVVAGNLAAGAKYVNLQLEGNSDTPTNIFQVNGSPAVGAELRYSINGIIKNDAIAWVPAIAINNSAAGITYTARAASYVQVGKMVMAEFFVILSSKGASVGNVILTGLPMTARTGVNGSCVIGLYSDLAGLTGALGGYVPGGFAAGVAFQQQGAAATVALTNTELTNTSRIDGTIVFLTD